jgi:hypothetical protein
LRDAGQCLGNQRSRCNSGNSFNNLKRNVGRCRSNCSGSNSSGGNCNNTGPGCSSWGTGTTPYGSEGGGQADNKAWTDGWQETGTHRENVRDYYDIYDPRTTQGQSYDTQLQGKLTEEGGSYVFTQIVDPTTGDTSYVPYFELQPTDISAIMDAMEDQEVPRTYSDIVRLYFESLTNGGATADSPDNSETEPAE